MHLYEEEDNKFVKVATFYPHTRAKDLRYGNSVAISGNVTVVGMTHSALHDKRNFIEILTKGESGVWTRSQIVEAPDDDDSGYFGHILSVDGDNRRIAVGSLQAPINVLEEVQYDDYREWRIEAVVCDPDIDYNYDDNDGNCHGFGSNLAIHGNKLVVGDKQSNAVFIFRRGDTSDSWLLESTIRDDYEHYGGGPIDYDGRTIAVQGGRGVINLYTGPYGEDIRIVPSYTIYPPTGYQFGTMSLSRDILVVQMLDNINGIPHAEVYKRDEDEGRWRFAQELHGENKKQGVSAVSVSRTGGANYLVAGMAGYENGPVVVFKECTDDEGHCAKASSGTFRNCFLAVSFVAWLSSTLFLSMG